MAIHAVMVADGITALLNSKQSDRLVIDFVKKGIVGGVIAVAIVIEFEYG